MRFVIFRFIALAWICTLIGCGSPGVPQPIRVLENPTTGERVRFFREIGFKVPKGYDERKHLADWTATQEESGFTSEVFPEDDRARLAELRAKNLAASRQ